MLHTDLETQEKDDDLSEALSMECSWPTLHGDLMTYMSTGLYRKKAIGSSSRQLYGTRAGRSQNESNYNVSAESSYKPVRERTEDLLKFLTKDLEERLYKPSEIKLVEHTRLLLDLNSLVAKIKASSVPHVSNVLVRDYWQSCCFFHPDMESIVDRDEFHLQFQRLLFALDHISRKNPNHSNIELLKDLLKSKEEWYKSNPSHIQ